MGVPIAGRPDPKRREPLWDRVDRNRFRLIVYLAAFGIVMSVFVGFGLVIVATALLPIAWYFGFGGGTVAFALTWLLGGGVWRPWVLGVVSAAIYEAWALVRSEKWLLRRLDARFVPKGERFEIKMALKDMAIASGLPVAPALYALDTTNVNAFVFKAPGRRAVLGVTEGFATRLSLGEQRAVFANLVARLVSGDTMVSSAVTSLLAPLNWYRDHRIRALDAEDKMFAKAAEERRHNPTSTEDSSGLSGLVVLLPLLVPLIFAGEVIATAQRRSQLTAAEKADAEGMLLLKDPDSMLSALEECVRLDNVVVEAGQSLGDIFYCWTGDSTNDENDPEWRRVARLREVLGVWGWVPDSDELSVKEAEGVAPPAPRLEDQEV